LVEEAEDIAESNNWNDAQKLRFFPDRLKGEAKQCHNESKLRVRAGSELDPPFSYAVWRADMLERFRNNKDIEQIRQHLATLRQSSDQRTKAFVARLNKLYVSVYGKDPEAPENPNPRESRLYKANIGLRDAKKKKLMLKGLLLKIKTELWSRMTENPTFPELRTTVYLAESRSGKLNFVGISRINTKIYWTSFMVQHRMEPTNRNLQMTFYYRIGV